MFGPVIGPRKSDLRGRRWRLRYAPGFLEAAFPILAVTSAVSATVAGGLGRAVPPHPIHEIEAGGRTYVAHFLIAIAFGQREQHLKNGVIGQNPTGQTGSTSRTGTYRSSRSLLPVSGPPAAAMATSSGTTRSAGNVVAPAALCAQPACRRQLAQVMVQLPGGAIAQCFGQRGRLLRPRQPTRSAIAA